MRRSITVALAALLIPAAATRAQTTVASSAAATRAAEVTCDPKTDATCDPEAAKAAKRALLVPTQQIDRIRLNDQRGLNTFEAPKTSTIPFTGFKLAFGAAFTQQFQGLQHSNDAAAKLVNGVNQNQLIAIGHGFNNAEANLYLDAQVAPGLRVAMTSYLSTRHHNETWVKDGYFLIDESPIDNPLLDAVMRYVTLKAGHFEINYGDGHFRRTDAGNALFNPLVGNYIMDAFTTSVGSEIYVRARGAFLMGAITNGEVRGTILNPAKRAPGFLGKAGLDEQLTKDLRVRLTGSVFSQARSANQTLYSGDRAGSRYYDVLENTTSTEAAQAWSGAINPGFGEMHAAVLNPFLAFRGLEYFGNFERAKGRNATELAAAAPVRAWAQVVNELTYRMGDMYVSGRYNTASGRLVGFTRDATVRRTQVGGGWFLTPLVMTKVEWVTQRYEDFPPTDIRAGGHFKGFMVEGVVAF